MAFCQSCNSSRCSPLVILSSCHLFLVILSSCHLFLVILSSVLDITEPNVTYKLCFGQCWFQYIVLYSNMTFFIAYLNNTVIKFLIYVTPHIRTGGHIMDIKWLHSFIMDHCAYIHTFVYMLIFSWKKNSTKDRLLSTL